MTFPNARFVLVLTALVGIAAPGFGYAHGGATGIVKQRMDAMVELKDANKALQGIAKRKKTPDMARIETLANTIAAHAREMPQLFPNTKQSRKSHATEARPSIWQDWDRFESLAKQLESDALALTADGSLEAPKLRERLKNMGKTCRECHKDFRKKKKKKKK